MTEPNRFTALDGMRGIAALAVMLHHFTQHTSQPLFASAGLAVDLFFCLSGFVIAHAYLGKLQTTLTGMRFLKKRLVRLYPMYVLGFVIGAPALIAKTLMGASSLSLVQALQATLLNLIYLPYVGTYHIALGNEQVRSVIFPVNDPAWSLFFELCVNFALAIWVTTRKRTTPLSLVVLSGVALAIYTRLTWAREPGFDSLHLLGGALRTMYGFFAGVAIFGMLDRVRARLPVVPPLVLFGALAVVLALPNISGVSTWLWLSNALILVPILVLLGVVSGSREPGLTRASDYLGWLSYPIYCLHFPIYVIFTLITANQDFGLGAALICTPITLILAHVLTKKVEAPVRAWLTAR